MSWILLPRKINKSLVLILPRRKVTLTRKARKPNLIKVISNSTRLTKYFKKSSILECMRLFTKKCNTCRRWKRNKKNFRINRHENFKKIKNNRSNKALRFSHKPENLKPLVNCNLVNKSQLNKITTMKLKIKETKFLDSRKTLVMLS